MARFIEKLNRAANKFGIFDFAIFKIYLVVVGILIGVYFAPFIMEWIGCVWVVAIISCIITLTQLIRYYTHK